VNPVAVIYAAKSTADLAGSINDQTERCRDYAASLGWEIAEPPESDEAASAYHGSRGPGLVRAKTRAAQLAKDGQETILLVWSSDRLARGDGKEGRAHLVEHVLDAIKADYRIESVSENLGGEMALVIAALYGERAHADSKVKSEHTKRGLEKAAREGRWHGPPPFGYRTEGQREERHLVVDDVDAGVVRSIFELFVTSGLGLAMVAHRLNEEGARSRHGGRWSRTTIQQILDSPVYLGKIQFNGKVLPGNHPAIIDQRTWEKAQAQRLARRPGKAGGRPPTSPFLLTGGLLRCGVCGSAMRPRTKPGRADRYECANRGEPGGSARCSMKGVLRETVDGPFLAYLETAAFDLKATRKTIAEEAKRRDTETTIMVRQAERAVTEVEAALTRIRADYTRGAITAEQWQGFEVELTEAREAATRELEQHREQANRFTVPDVDEEIAARLSVLREAVAGEVTRANAEGLQAVRSALRRYFSEITLWRSDADGLILVPKVLAWDDLVQWLDLRNGTALSMPRPARIEVPGQSSVAGRFR
jgi:DNA invertase Pin-like site-specific DNA recombinase